jgi:hypothetical protein
MDSHMHVDDSAAAAASETGAASAGAGAPAGEPPPTPQPENTKGPGPQPNVTFTIHPITLKENTGKKKVLLEPCHGVADVGAEDSDGDHNDVGQVTMSKRNSAWSA